MKKIVLCLVTLLSLGGCASHTYTDAPAAMGFVYSKYVQIGYEGGLKPIEEVGVITTDGLVKIQTLDGKPIGNFRLFKKGGLYSGGRYQLHLLPGTYVVGMSYRDNRGSTHIWSTSDVSKSITVTRGQVLHLSGTMRDSENSWDVQQSDGMAALPTIKEDFIELTADKK